MEPMKPLSNLVPLVKKDLEYTEKSNDKLVSPTAKSRVPHSKIIKESTQEADERKTTSKKLEEQANVISSKNNFSVNDNVENERIKIMNRLEAPLAESEKVDKVTEGVIVESTRKKSLVRTQSESFAEKLMSGPTAKFYTDINQRIDLQKNDRGLISMSKLREQFFSLPGLSTERLEWLKNDEVKLFLIKKGYTKAIKARIRGELIAEGKAHKSTDIVQRMTVADIIALSKEIEAKDPDLNHLSAHLWPGLIRGIAAYNLMKLILATKNLSPGVDQRVNKKFNGYGGMEKGTEGLPHFDRALKAFEELMLEKDPDPALAEMQSIFLEKRTSTSNSCSATAEGDSKAKKARTNYDAANQYIHKVAKKWRDNPQGPLLTLDILKKINRKLLDGVAAQDIIPGELRDHDVKTGVGLYLPEEKVKSRINQFIERLNDSVLEANKQGNKYEAFKVAVRSFNELVSDHPFGDGNGRTCRLVFDLVLLANGLPPCAFDGDEGNMANFGFVEDDAKALDVNKTIEDFVVNAAKALKRSAALLNEIDEMRTNMTKCDELCKRWAELKATLPEPGKLNREQQVRVDVFCKEVRSCQTRFYASFRSSLASDLSDRGMGNYSEIFKKLSDDVKRY